jgi:hypothetical protein
MYMPFTEKEKEEAVANILEQIALGRSVKKSVKYLKENNRLACNNDTFFNWLSESKSLADRYMRARENRADARFEKIDEVIDDVKAGMLETDKARIVIDTMKWQMGKEKGSVYGVKADITSKGESVAPKDATSVILSKLSQEELEAALAEVECNNTDA